MKKKAILTIIMPLTIMPIVASAECSWFDNTNYEEIYIKTYNKSLEYVSSENIAWYAKNPKYPEVVANLKKYRDFLVRIENNRKQKIPYNPLDDSVKWAYQKMIMFLQNTNLSFNNWIERIDNNDPDKSCHFPDGFFDQTIN